MGTDDDPSNDLCPDSSLITIRRIDDDMGGPKIWEIEAGPTDILCLGNPEGGGVLIPRGLYRMPFLMTVQEILD